MRFMILVKATPQSEAGVLPGEALLAAMADYHAQLAQAGVLLDRAGLRPSAAGWRIRHADGQATFREGPFAHTPELVAGYTLIQVRSREEAMEWTRRFPAPHGAGIEAEIEVRPLYEAGDLRPADAAAPLKAAAPSSASLG